MLADEVDFVIGVDPHRDQHALAVVRAATGEVVHQATAAASSSGYAAVLKAAVVYAPGRRVFAIEGSGSYGRGLTRALHNEGERVVEVGRIKRGRRGGKSDALDAIRAARSALEADTQAQPRASGKREALRTLMITREGGIDARRAALTQLRALIVTAPEPQRAQLQQLTTAKLLAQLAASQPTRRRDPELRGTLLAMRTLARRIQHLVLEQRALDGEIATLVDELAPALQHEPGVGPITAAQLVISYSHHGRIRNEAAFARLAGAAPIPASSGQTIRYRLDRGGDRQLNRALHTIVLSRRHGHQPTLDYIARRISEGKTPRDTTRCLKRYLARHLYRLLREAPLTT